MSYSTPRPLSYLIDAISELERRIQRLEAALQCEGRIVTECARVSPIEENQVRRVITARRIRNQHLGSDLVADPAWDLLLGAFAAELGGDRIEVPDLCRTTTVPPSTALRWIKKLEADGWVQLQPSSDETCWIEMTPDGLTRLSQLFDAVGAALVLA